MAGAIASIMVGIVSTLTLETLGFFEIYTVPVGVTVSGLSLVLSFLVFLVVSRFTGGAEGEGIDEDVRLVMGA